MALLAALLAQALHGALVLAAAVLLPGLVAWLSARFLGARGPRPWQPWREWRALWGARLLRRAAAGPPGAAAPPLAAAAALAAALLVPGFSTGMLLAPLADLTVVFGLLALAEAIRLFVLLDQGHPAAPRALALLPFLLPAGLLVLAGLALLGGGTHLPTLIAALREGAAPLPTGLLLAALAALALSALGLPPAPLDPALPDATGRDLLCWRLHAAGRLIAWAGLFVALAWPWGVAEPGAGFLAALFGILAWVGKLLLVAPALALLGLLAPRWPLARAPEWLGGAALLAGLAAALIFVAAAQA
ncbi:MAG: hypothetical protein NZN45_08760 [Rhodovarius sp.]|nr:hypothetical protein [Rhodovarius sp.]